MELGELAAFVRIVESGSLTAAARATRQSLASVSRQLRALEADLGVALVLRTTRSLAVTAEGRDLYQRATRILRDVAEARDGSRQGRLRGALTVSLPVTLGQALLVPRLARLWREHPGLQLEVRLEDRLTDLIVEGVDLVVRAGTALPDSTAFIATPLLEFTRVLVAAPGLLGPRSLPRTPAALANLDCLLQVGAGGPVRRWKLVRDGEARPVGEQQRGARRAANRPATTRPAAQSAATRPAAAQQETVEVRGNVSSTAPLVLRAAALGGAGVALLPEWLIAPDLKRKKLVRLLPEWRSPPITAWAMYRQDLRGSAQVRAFLDAMGAAPE